MTMLIFGKIFILLSVLVSISTSNGVSRSGVDYSKPNCKVIVCEQANEQAKGLSQLALLDEFVSQTILLLNDLMRNMDGEIEKSAKSLLRYIHPHCGSTQKILSEVIEKQKDKLGSEPRLGTGIKPMTDDDQEDQDRSNESDHFGGGQDNYNYEERSTAGVSQNNQWSSSYDSGNVASQKSVSDYDDSDYVDKSEEDKFSGRGWNGRWRGVEKSDEQKGYKWSNSHSKRSDALDKTNLSSSHSRKGKVIYEGEIDDKHDSDLGFKICRGVNRGSAFWVPGLDKWCQDSCSMGYCPKTHCVC